MRSNARMAAASAQHNQIQMPPGMPGGAFFPPAFMNMAPWMMMAPPHTAPGIGPMNPNPNTQPTAPGNADIIFPEVYTWADHCDSDPRRARLCRVGPLRQKLADEGYIDIDQLTSDHVSQVDLAEALKIGLGIAGLVIKWADEGVAKVCQGTYVPNTNE